MEVISYLNKNKLPGVIAVIDFEKCFDHIAHNSIKAVLCYFGCGEYFVHMTSLLFTNIELCTSSNGYLSEMFCKNRGSNQGCPGSPLIFTICSEVMSHLIQQNKNIKGIPMPHLKNLLSQFADDTSAFLNYDRITIENFTTTLTLVEEQMGLRVSYDKTTLYRVGSLKNSDAKLYTERDFCWDNGPIVMLGMKISCDEMNYPGNYEEIIGKVKKVCENWYNRSHTLYGRIVILNMLVGSLFTYRITVMQDLDKTQIKEIESIMREFIWLGKSPKISLYMLQRKAEQGGLKLTCIKTKQKALKISWIRQLDNDAMLANCAFEALDPCLKGLIWRCNLTKKDIIKEFDQSFWWEVLIAWCEINYHDPQTKSQVLQQMLWRNSNIKIKGKTVCWRKWVEQGIYYIEDIWGKNAQTLGVNWLELYNLSSAIPPYWVVLLKKLDMGEKGTPMYDQLLSCGAKVSRFAYNLLVDDQDNTVTKYANRWITKYDIVNFDFTNYQKCFSRVRLCTNVSKYCDFQYRLLLDKIITNENLFNWGMKHTDVCNFCGEETENTLHLFWYCQFVQPIIKFIVALCRKQNIEFTEEPFSFIWNNCNRNGVHIINFICIFAKQYIYRMRCNKQKPNIIGFWSELESFQEIEFFVAKRNFTVNKHIRKWSPIFTSRRFSIHLQEEDIM